MAISAEADDQASSRSCGLPHQHAEKKPQKTKEARPPRDVSPDDDVGKFDVIVDDGDSDDVVPETPPPHRRRGKSLTLTILMRNCEFKSQAYGGMRNM